MNKQQVLVIRAILNLTNDIARKDPNMKGAQSYEGYHYGNAISLVLHHLDNSYDIRWLEPAYDYWKSKIEEYLTLPKSKEESK